MDNSSNDYSSFLLALQLDLIIMCACILGFGLIRYWRGDSEKHRFNAKEEVKQKLFRGDSTAAQKLA